MKYSNNKELNELLDQIRNNCSKIVIGGKHIKVYPLHSSIMITISRTASDKNVLQAIRRDLRRAGIQV